MNLYLASSLISIHSRARYYIWRLRLRLKCFVHRVGDSVCSCLFFRIKSSQWSTSKPRDKSHQVCVCNVKATPNLTFMSADQVQSKWCLKGNDPQQFFNRIKVVLRGNDPPSLALGISSSPINCLLFGTVSTQSHQNGRTECTSLASNSTF